jgi:hypothetical protein
MHRKDRFTYIINGALLAIFLELSIGYRFYFQEVTIDALLLEGLKGALI